MIPISKQTQQQNEAVTASLKQLMWHVAEGRKKKRGYGGMVVTATGWSKSGPLWWVPITFPIRLRVYGSTGLVETELSGQLFDSSYFIYLGVKDTFTFR